VGWDRRPKKTKSPPNLKPGTIAAPGKGGVGKALSVKEKGMAARRRKSEGGK